MKQKSEFYMDLESAKGHIEEEADEGWFVQAMVTAPESRLNMDNSIIGILVVYRKAKK
jgi:hypothetical protein